MNRRLGRYELLHRLGAGGAGEVWEALLHGPAGFQRKVAIKLLRDGRREERAKDALLQEARLGALVSHPSVVSTLELDEVDGRWFMVMDLVIGQSAESLGQRGPLPPAALLDLGIQACDGLAHIHELRDNDGWPLGLVHRDIKPSNLMVDETGRVRVVDLGIARLTGTPDVPSGTPGFMAPEQLRGKEDHRSDLFSLGVTLIRLATRRLPFGKGQIAIARMLEPTGEEVAFPALLQALDGMVPGLGSVLIRCIRMDPEQRWASARDLQAALQRLQADCPPSDDLRGMKPLGTRRPDRTPAGLTTERGRFVARDDEVRAVTQLIDQGTRWILLAGPGGVGKTRLVDEVVRDRDVVRCDASKVTTLEGLCHVVVEALEGSIQGDPLQSVATHLATRGPTLLVLDEIERSAETTAQAIDAWLKECPEARFLCTSRVASGDAGVTVVRVGPLPLPAAQALFELRLGRAVDPAVAIPLVRLLDRLPLAIELAAARARNTSPERVLAQLQSSSSAEVPSLRQGLQASWELLPDDARRALALLTSYRGSFDDRDATAVLDDDAPAIERLEQLVDHSVLAVRQNRFRLLTSVRDFARSQLPEARQAGDRRHGTWMARLGRTDALDNANSSLEAARTFVNMLDELLVARDRSLRDDVPEVAVACTLAASYALVRIGPMRDIEMLVDGVLHLGHRRADLLRVRAHAEHAGGRPADAEATLREGLEIATGHTEQRMKVSLAAALHTQGKPGAIELLEALAEDLEALGPQRAASVQTLLGQLLYMGHRIDEAEACLTSALENAIRYRLDDVGHIRGSLAAARRRQGCFEDSARLYEQAVKDLVDVNDVLLAVHTVNQAGALVFMGHLAAAKTAAEQARVLGARVGRKPTEGIAHTVLCDVARLQGDLGAARDHAQAAWALAQEINNGNLSAEAELSMAKVALTGGRPQGMDHLRAAFAQTGLIEPETRAEMTLWCALHAPLAEAEARIHTTEAERYGNTKLSEVITALARATLEERRGRIGEARAALLTGSAAMARFDLPDTAPLSIAYARLRERLSHGRPARS